MKTEAGIPLITAKNVRMGFVREEPREFIAVEAYTSWMTRGIPKAGDVLFTTEAPLGLVAQLMTDEKRAFAQRVVVLQPQERLDGGFLKYLLMSPTLQARIHREATGATALGIKASLLKTIDIMFPKSLSEQSALSSRFQAIEEKTKEVQALYEKKLSSYRRLRQSLLNDAFSGNL